MKKSDILLNDPRQNNILASLKKADFDRIFPHLKLVEMPLGWTIAEAGELEKYIHFPISGIVSLIYDLEDGSSSEVAMVGNEGMLGISIYMGGESMPNSTKVQCAGKAYRLSRNLFKREFALSGQLQRIALLYTQALIAQTSQTAVCNQHHTKEQQFCRWLLMKLDRLSDNQVIITHSSIAKLIGIRRETVSVAAENLQKDGIIECSRGQITIMSTLELNNRACECYGIVTKEYRRLLPTVK